MICVITDGRTCCELTMVLIGYRNPQKSQRKHVNAANSIKYGRGLKSECSPCAAEISRMVFKSDCLLPLHLWVINIDFNRFFKVLKAILNMTLFIIVVRARKTRNFVQLQLTCIAILTSVLPH